MASSSPPVAAASGQVPWTLRTASRLMLVALAGCGLGAIVAVAGETRNFQNLQGNNWVLIVWAAVFLAVTAGWVGVSFLIVRGLRGSRPWVRGLAIARALAALPLALVSLVAAAFGGLAAMASLTGGNLLGVRAQSREAPIWLCIALVGAAFLAAEVLTFAAGLALLRRRPRG